MKVTKLLLKQLIKEELKILKIDEKNVSVS